MAVLLVFTFLSGVVTIFAPCIWPLLPIILSASTSGGHRKPLGIVTGIAASFTVFTLSLSYILKVIPFDPEILRYFAVGIIAFLGVMLVVPAFGKYLEALASRWSGFGGRFILQEGTGFGSGFITGAALGLVWTPCAGPILATVATLAATQAVNAAVVFITLTFVLGVSVPLYGFSLVGKKLLTQTRALSPYTGRIQQVFGVIMILTAFAIYTGYDRTLQTKLLDAFPAYTSFLNQFEKNDAVKSELDALKSGGTQKNQSSFLEKTKKLMDTSRTALANYGPAPEFAGIEQWLNTENGALSVEGLRGKVVLVDFWTYSCINCIRTLPYVTSWYEKYKDQGFVVIGVHTPEFEFEKKTDNVLDAMRRYKINYPVAQDNQYGTWQAYNNRYWPAHYLIDAQGNVRQYHFGEGKYEETEAAIRALLEEAGQRVAADTVSEDMPAETASGRQTPETYLGNARMERFASPEKITGEAQVFTAPEKIAKHSFAYSGIWKVENERAIASADARLKLRFEGKKVFLVMAPVVAGQKLSVAIYLDGQPVAEAFSGNDVQDGRVTVDADRLYELIDLRGAVGEHTLELRFEDAGMAVYAFTFA